jgi:hypothetical protein
MDAGRFFCLVLGGLVACGAAQPALAEGPWNKLVVFKHLESDPNQLYPINENNGPWMIMAASFSGPQSEEQARRLIYELRKDFKMPAYSYQKKFDFTKSVEGRGLTPEGEAPKMRYNRSEDYTEIAVLVGDYTTVDDPEAQKVLKRLKTASPKSFEGQHVADLNQTLAAVRTIQKQLTEAMLATEKSGQKPGPMHNAFIITNPFLPSEYFVPKGLDKFVVEMNKAVPHSLLDCPGKYTVQVATFTGHAIILDEKRQQAIDRGELPKSYLEDAARSAHLLTEALRKRNFEAYEFHDRSSSIVTVGSFDSVGTKRDDGKIELNPAVHKIMTTFGVETKVVAGKSPKVGKPKKLGGIPFDMQPMPVEVPRRAISTDYASRPTTTVR